MQPIPFDILESITNILASEDNLDNQNSASIIADLPTRSRALSISGFKDTVRFYELVKVNPDIPLYTKYLLDNHIDERERQLFKVLRKRCRSYSIELGSALGYDWTQFPESTQSSVVALIQLPTITRLKLEPRLTKFPVTAAK